MDLTKLSNEDLLALKAGDLSKVSNEGLMAMRQPAEAAPPANLGVAANAGNKALAAIPDTVLNAPTNLWNLAKSGAVLGGRALGFDTHLPYTEPPNVVQRQMARLGLIDPAYDPKTAGQRMLAAGTGGAVSMAAGPANSAKQLASLLGTGAASGLVGQGTKEVTGSDTAAMVAGAFTPVAVNMAANSARNKISDLAAQQKRNAPADETLTRAMEEGYQVPPSTVKPTLTNRVLESIAGKAATQQAVSTKNAEVTDRLARQSVGLAPDAPLTAEAMQKIRKDAFNQGYKPVKDAGVISTGKLYRDDLDRIEAQYKGAARSFPDAVTDDIAKLIAPLRRRAFDAGDAVDMVQTLRDNASKAFASGDKSLGNANRAAAKAIEDQIERGLSAKANSPQLLEGFRDARKLMAKTHTVENAIKEGGGNVDANKIARELQKGAPLSDELETIGRFANVYSKANQTPQVVGSQGVSKVAALASALMGGGGGAALGPAGVALGAVPFVAPPAAQSLILSKKFQQGLKPNYDAKLLAKILSESPELSYQPLMQQMNMAQQLKGQ